MIGIVDIGLGNLSSVKNTVESLFFKSEIIHDPLKTRLCSHLILPGVGSFKFGMNQIRSLGWENPLINFAQSGKPILGICLGMQLLFSHGDEFGSENGLNLIPGSVKKLEQNHGIKLPHVGWNSFIELRDHQVISNINPNIDVYFVHSYHCIPDDKKHILGISEYSEKFVSIVGKENIIGTQFHPEKSQPSGVKLLRNFLNWNPSC